MTFCRTRTGELIAEHPCASPEPGVKHVGFVLLQPHPDHRSVHDVLRHQVSTMS